LLKYGDKVLIYLEDGSEYIITLEEGKFLGTHFGNIFHEDIVGKEYGDSISLRKHSAYILNIGIVDHIFSLKRKTQIVYPKDMGFILLMLDVKNGDLVVECGSGSGSMTSALARAVAPDGRVVSYERREEFHKLAKENVECFGHSENVVFKLKDISEGIDESNVNAFFLDVPEPVPHLKTVSNSLIGGGRFCVVCPTANQVQDVLRELRRLPVIKVEIWETFIRKMKLNPERFRPEDRMVGHTTYMVFGIKVNEGGVRYEENR